MEVLFDVAAGIDVHRNAVVVSVRSRRSKKEQVETRTFETFHDSLVEMAGWLEEQQVPVVGLESTGVYWMPVVRVLQERSPKLLVWLVNPLEVKKVPGRKTDVNDSQWISKLTMHGLVSPSMLPSKQLQELRALTRFRTRVVAARTSCSNQVVKQMEVFGIKLPSVCSDPLGKSGRAMLDALLEGTSSPSQIAQLARGTLRKKIPLLERAACGSFSAASRIVLRQLLARLDQLDRDINALDAEIATLLMPMRECAELLRTAPGFDDIVIAAVLAEIGPDMSVFPSADSIAAWAGLSPGSNESAGKTKRAPVRKGNRYLRTILVQAAWAATNTLKTFWHTTFRRLVGRLGPKKTIIAIARKMLVAAYYMLRDRRPYLEPPNPPPSPQRRDRLARRYTEQLRKLGFDVQITPLENDKAA